MSTYTVYDPGTGDIKFTLLGSVVEGDVPAGMEVAEGQFDSGKYYFDGTEFTERPVMNLQFSAEDVPAGEYFSVQNIPEGTMLEYPDGEPIEIDDGFFEWSTDFPGNYQFELTKHPYLSRIISAVFV